MSKLRIYQYYLFEQVGGAQKLPVMYLIDSIMKNVGREYIKLFGHNIINIFCNVFEKVSIFCCLIYSHIFDFKNCGN